METLNLADLYRQSQERLEQRVTHPVLIVGPPTLADHAGFKTTIVGPVTGDGLERIDDLAEMADPLRAALMVFPLVKKASSFGDGVWIGRAHNCDVPLPFATISKLHANITQDERGGYLISDLGSRNGTFVEGTRLAKGAATPLGKDAQIKLGGLRARFMLPPRFVAQVCAFNAAHP